MSDAARESGGGGGAAAASDEVLPPAAAALPIEGDNEDEEEEGCPPLPSPSSEDATDEKQERSDAADDGVAASASAAAFAAVAVADAVEDDGDHMERPAPKPADGADGGAMTAVPFDAAAAAADDAVAATDEDDRPSHASRRRSSAASSSGADSDACVGPGGGGGGLADRRRGAASSSSVPLSVSASGFVPSAAASASPPSASDSMVRRRMPPLGRRRVRAPGAYEVVSGRASRRMAADDGNVDEADEGSGHAEEEGEEPVAVAVADDDGGGTGGDEIPMASDARAADSERSGDGDADDDGGGAAEDEEDVEAQALAAGAGAEAEAEVAVAPSSALTNGGDGAARSGGRAGGDDDGRGGTSAATVVRAEIVGWKTYLHDRRVVGAAAVVVLIVAGLAVGLGVSLSNSGGGGSGEMAATNANGGGDDPGATPTPEEASSGGGVSNGSSAGEGLSENEGNSSIVDEGNSSVSIGGGERNDTDIIPVDGECALGYKPRCGDCWCAPDGPDDAGSCPTYPEGWINACTPGAAELADLYASLVPASLPENPDPGMLPVWVGGAGAEAGAGGGSFVTGSSAMDGGGTPCNPFIFHLGNATDNPYDGLPLCDASDEEVSFFDAVCAFKVLDDDDDESESGNYTEECRLPFNRTYDLRTYSNAQEALSDGAHVTHLGHCGHCSTLDNLAAFLRNLDSLYEKSAICTNGEATNGDYAEMRRCFVEHVGFSEPCATAYALVGVGQHAFCSDACAPHRVPGAVEDKLWMGGPAPLCEEAPCLKCVRENVAFGLLRYVRRADVVGSIMADARYGCSTVQYLPFVDNFLCK